MNPWSIIDTLAEVLIHFGCSWRTFLCFVVGVALAAAACERTSAEPLRWIVAGAIIIASLMVGSKWNDSR